MPRGEEYESEEQHRARRPARYDNRDDELDDEPDDAPPRRRIRNREGERSTLVLAVGIVELVLAGLYLACGILGSMTGACCTGGMPMMQQFMAQQAKQDRQAAQAVEQLGQLQVMGWLALAEGILDIGIGLVMLIGGIGVLRRANWARYLTLGIAAVAVLLELVCMVTKAIIMFSPGDLVGGVLSVVLALGFAGFAYPVLLMPQGAKEFT
jgi:hypothetical protein